MESLSILHFLLFAVAITAYGVQGTALHAAECPALEPRGSAKWLVRDADTFWPLNHTAITATARYVSMIWEGLTYACQVQVFSETTNELGEISLSLPKEYNILLVAVTFEMAGYYPITVRQFQIGWSPGAQTTFMEPLLFISRRFNGSGGETGRFRDFSDYTVLGGVQLDFRSDMNNHTGSVVESITTSADGTWSVTLPGGHYTMTASKSGYITVPYTVVILGGQIKRFGDLGMSPTLQDGAFRVVSLKRIDVSGFCPAIHVRGPLEGRSERAHIHREDRESPDGLVQYEVSDWYIESLLVKKQLAGVYRIIVSDYQTLKGYRSGAPSDISNSYGNVHLYRGDLLWGYYFVPNHLGNAWRLADIDGLYITTINEMKTVTSVEDVD